MYYNESPIVLYDVRPSITKDVLLTYRFKRTLSEAFPHDLSNSACIYDGDVLGYASPQAGFISWIAAQAVRFLNKGVKL